MRPKLSCWGQIFPILRAPWTVSRATCLRAGFILSVSTIQVRKNQQLLYNLWRRFAEEQRHAFPRLVLVGANGWLTEELRKQINSDPLTKDSILVLNPRW